MNAINRFYWRLLEKLHEHYHSFRLIETTIGIKTLNGNQFREPNKILNGEVLTLSPSELFFGPDMLKDKFTLLGVNVQDSPHYLLMLDLLNNGNIEKSIYIKRRKQGILDGRIGIRENSSMAVFYERFKKRHKEIMDQSYSPVLVYKVSSRYYIYDGKHRAALCTALDRPIRCMDISQTFHPGGAFVCFYNWKRQEKNYSKHIAFFDSYCNQYFE